MRILIGYDGSDCSDAAVDDLARAGLPPDVEAEVMAVADIPTSVAVAEAAGSRSAPTIREYLNEERTRARTDAEWTADKAAARLRHLFDGWKVETNTALGRPHEELLKRAEAWPADLLVLGSHGRGALGRLWFGSVAQYAVHHCGRSLRIGRAARQGAGPLHLMIATDGSPTAAAACRALAQRHWPEETRVRVLSISERVWMPMGTPEAPELLTSDATMVAEAREAAERHAAMAARELEGAGLIPTPVTFEGQARHDIVEDAEREQVDCVFLGAVGHGMVDRFLVGSVAAAVATRAHCSVEIVRG